MNRVAINFRHSVMYPHRLCDWLSFHNSFRPDSMKKDERPGEQEQEAVSTEVRTVKTAADLVRMLEAINTNMEYDVDELLSEYENYVTRKGTKVESIDRVLLRYELAYIKQHKLVTRTIAEAMGYTTDALEDALIRFKSRSLAGSGQDMAMTADEIEQIERCIETLGHFQQRVKGSTLPTPTTAIQAISMLKAAKIQAMATVGLDMIRSPDMITKLEGYRAAAEAQTKCEILRRAGLPVPADLLKAADEECYESGNPIAEVFETRMREAIEQQGIGEVEYAIALTLYSDDPKFDETIIALIYLVCGFC